MSEQPVFWLSDDTWEKMIKLAQEKHPLETGGILLGYTNSKHTIVTAIIGPGSNAQHFRSRFVPDAKYHQRQIEAHFEKTGGNDTYLGDWHTHPEGVARLSWRDKRTLNKIAAEGENLITPPTMAILAGGPNNWHLRTFHYSDRHLHIPLIMKHPCMQIKHY